MLYNEFRPEKMRDLKGQEIIKNTITKKLEEGTLPHSMLFIGVRGTGKTTSARIVAKAVNCENPQHGEPCCQCKNCLAISNESTFDVQEMDAAANRKVDDMNSLLESINTVPLMKKKVFIVDEVHMLTQEASNRLLKVLEEPPKNVHFILCTTELHKVLPTIRSRCCLFNFKAIDEVTIASELSRICEDKSIDYELDAMYTVAKAARGSMRDALSLLEPMLANGNVSSAYVEESLGIMNSGQVLKLLDATFNKNAIKVQDLLDDAVETGKGIDMLLESSLEAITNMLLIKLAGSSDSILNTKEYKETLARLAKLTDNNELMGLFNELKEVREGLAKDSNPKLSTFCAFLNYIYKEQRKDEIVALKEELSFIKQQISSNSLPKNLSTVQSVLNQEPESENTKSDQKESEKETSLEEPKYISSADDFIPISDEELSMYEEMFESEEYTELPVESNQKNISEPVKQEPLQEKTSVTGYLGMLGNMMSLNNSENLNSTIAEEKENEIRPNNPEPDMSKSQGMSDEMMAVFAASGLQTGGAVVLQNDYTASNVSNKDANGSNDVSVEKEKKMDFRGNTEPSERNSKSNAVSEQMNTNETDAVLETEPSKSDVVPMDLFANFSII